MTQCELIEILGQPNALSRKKTQQCFAESEAVAVAAERRTAGKWKKRCQDKVFVSVVVSGIVDRGGDRHKQDSASPPPPPFSPMKHSDESHSERE